MAIIQSAPPTPARPPHASSPPIASTRMRLTDFSKPFKNEALIRLRASFLSLTVLALATALLPVPSLWAAARIVRRAWIDHTPSDWPDVGGVPARAHVLWGICAAELALAALLALNFVQAAYALRYPRTPLQPPPASPARSLGLATPQAKQRRPIVVHSKNPQTHRTSSASTSLYASSPVSTPSRTLRYSLPIGISLGSSTSSLPPTPSPAVSLSAYHARHATVSGHAFDGLALSRLAREEEEEES